MSDIGVKLTGDKSEFVRTLDAAVEDGTKFAGKIGGKVTDKLFDFKDSATAIATALGVNIEKIAENVARFITGVSKDEEEALKKIELLSSQIADKSIENMRARLTEEQRYQLNLQDRDRLLKTIAESEGKSAKDQAVVGEARLALENKVADIQKYELDQAEKRQKQADEYLKQRIDGNEKEVKAQMDLLEGAAKIAAMKQNIADLQGIIAGGALTEKNAELLTVQLNERKAALIDEQSKQAKALADIQKKNSDAQADSVQKQADAAREILTVDQRRKLILDDIKKTQLEIQVGQLFDLDVSEKIKRVDELRGNLKDAEKEKAQDNIELATLMLKGVENLDEKEKIRLQILTGQTTQAKLNLEIADLTAKAVAGTLTPAERDRLEVLTGQTAQTDKQKKNAEDILALVQAQVKVIESSHGETYASMSDQALRGLLERTQAALYEAQRQDTMAGYHVGGTYHSPEATQRANDVAKIEAELNQRSTVSNYAQRFGEDAAVRKYGDALAERALSDIRDSQTRGTLALEAISQQLMPVFPKK